MRQLIIILFLMIAGNSFAQYGNEWIDYTKEHYAISVNQEGVYRVTGTALNAAGLSGTPIDNFRMFRNGEEIPIYVATNGVNVSFIEFYGYPNDGKPDTQLYRDSDWQPHDKYSLFTDPAIYYLTYNSSGNNLRIVNTPNDLTNLPPKENYFVYTAQRIFSSDFSLGEPVYVGSSSLYNSLFDNGEGFYGSSSNQFNNSATSKNFGLATPNRYAVGPDAELRAVVIGTTTQAHHYKINVGGTELADEQFTDYTVVRTNTNLPVNLMSDVTTVNFQSIPTSSGTNRNTPSLIEIDYPRTFNMSGASQFAFKMIGNAQKQFIEISNFNDLGTQPVLYDVTNGHRIVSIDVGGSAIHRFALPAATGERQLVIRANNLSEVTAVNSMDYLELKNFSSLENQGNYVIVSHNSLIASPELQEYVQYRSSVAGGEYQVAVVDIDQLYHQFAYGIDKHPQSVRGFVAFAKDNWFIDPELLFIVGKAREYQEFRNNATARNKCLVPTFGNPGSDVLISAQGGNSTPVIAIGRLAAKDFTQVGQYFDKVIEYEQELNKVGDPYQTIADKDYMKQILHFGGGNNGSEQNQFKNYLNYYAGLAEDTLWGANTYSVFKTSSNPLQNVQSDFLRQRIDDGVSLITFFGHSYAGGFDVSFDEPENYTNIGKYPVYLANGCNAGIIHTGEVSVSERFIFAEQKGSIAYVSTTALSQSSALHRYSSAVYQHLSQEDYLNTIGQTFQQAVQDIQNCCSNNPSDMMVAQEMTLHGDPAIKWNQYSEPDYDIEAQNVFFEPSVVTTANDSFNINLDLYNLGKAINDSFNVEIQRVLPNGNQEIYVKRFAAPHYRDTLFIAIPTNVELEGLGLNTFSIYVDVNDEIQNELSETNNNLINEISLVIGSDDIYPIYPYEFAIVPQQNPTLKASTGNPLAALATYEFQIDTSELFINPLAQTAVSSTGGVVNWQLPTTMTDSTVYYWRVGKSGSNNWQYSSFIYLANEFPGWNQSHYYQWLKDDFSNIYLDTDRQFKFEDDVKEVQVQTGNVNFNEMKWVLNGAKQHNWQMNNCGGGVGYPNGFTIAVIKQTDGEPTEVINSSNSSYGPYGNIHCASSVDLKLVANFRAYGSAPSGHPNAGTPWASLILDYLNNEVPDGYYVIIYSINNPRFDLMDPTLLSYLNSRGASVSASTNGPMILAYQENGVASTNIAYEIGSSYSDVVYSSFVITGTWNSGRFESTLIGPAASWGSFHWKFDALEDPTNDIQNVEIYGTTSANDFGNLLITVPSTTLDTAISSIDASIYPYIRLRFIASDQLDRTPAQPHYWRILYELPPELAINPNRHFEITADTIDQGNEWKVEVALENVTPSNMDSIWASYSRKYGNGSISQVFEPEANIDGLDTIHLTFSEVTLDNKYPGSNLLTVEANPLSFNHRLEQFHFNNFLQIDYDVLGDKENPLLDVTFDGIHILDGDIVSAKPEIVIDLKDENLFLALDDTSLFDIYLRQIQPSVTGLERISFNSPDVLFIPASITNGQNKAQVVVQGNFPNDGVYELVVRSADKSGNQSSGTEDRIIDLVYYDYKISFEVINQTTVSNVLNYPNPFTTSTQFVFTLTGSELPDYMEIQIMNVKGTVVRQITMGELGPIHIGLNRTQYTWNGRDQYGDLLANGVYFYKIITSKDNQEIEHYAIEQVDPFFKRGIGKMVMIR